MCLLDTTVVSELRRPRPHGAVLTWIAAVDDAHWEPRDPDMVKAMLERLEQLRAEGVPDLIED